MRNSELSAKDAAPRRAAMAIALLAAASVPLAGCPQENAAENACTGAQALSSGEIRGSSLPAKTVALTFDDGPGARTAELSTYLKQEGVRAAFFVNGKQVGTGVGQQPASVLAQLVADGHVVANHTQTHPDLTTLADNVVVDEVTQTDAIIAPYVTNNRLLFRPPFGAWDPAKTYGALQSSAMQKYVGPVSWDIGDQMGPNQAADWDCWVMGNDNQQLTTTQCGDLYFAEIEAKGKGIVLLHDPYGWASGHTVDMVKYLVPKLKAAGYKFERVDMVPDLAALLPPLPPEDAGAEAGSSSSGGTSSSGGSSGTPDASTSSSGGNPDPCPPSPQTSPAHTGESGHLRAR